MVGSMLRNAGRTLLIIAALLSLVFVMIAAAPTAQTEIPPLCTLLTWLRTIEGVVAAVPIAVGVVISFLVETWSGWGAIAPKAKRWIVFGATFILPIAALGLSALLCTETLTVEAFYVALAAGFIAFGTSTLAHARQL